MGSLLFGSLVLKFVAAMVKKGRTANQVKTKIPHAVQDKLKTLQPVLQHQTPTAVSRQELKHIYAQQQKTLAKHPEIKTHESLVIAQTTVLGNYLNEQDWQDLAEQRLDDLVILQRVESGFDIQVHERIANAVRRAGFVNVRGEIKTGTKQRVAFSDDAGHGVRIAIDHTDESRIGVDLIGYQGAECQQKQKELLAALAAEGIIVDNMRTSHHGDPEGYKAHVQSTGSNTSKQQQQRRRRGGQHVKLT